MMKKINLFIDIGILIAFLIASEPRILGESWSSSAQPIRFTGDKGATGIPSGFQVFTEAHLPFPQP